MTDYRVSVFNYLIKRVLHAFGVLENIRSYMTRLFLLFIVVI